MRHLRDLTKSFVKQPNTSPVKVGTVYDNEHLLFLLMAPAPTLRLCSDILVEQATNLSRINTLETDHEKMIARRYTTETIT